jgi:hypothetical protein
MALARWAAERARRRAGLGLISELNLESPVSAASEITPVVRVPLAGLLAWAVPGLGHVFIGQRVRGLIFLITIAVTFWGGVAIGGVCESVDPKARTAWFMAQSCTGAHALAVYAWGERLGRGDQAPPRTRAPWMSAETGIVYCGVAGLLNILVILDALARADALAPAAARVTARARKGVP